MEKKKKKGREAFLRLRAENSQAKNYLLFGEKEKRSDQWTLNILYIKNRAPFWLIFESEEKLDSRPVNGEEESLSIATRRTQP